METKELRLLVAILTAERKDIKRMVGEQKMIETLSPYN